MKLAACFPWDSPFIWTDSVESMLQLHRPEETQFFRGKGWCPARRHIHCCELAFHWGADVMCFLGSDQTYEPDMLERLIGRIHEGYDAVAALVPFRGYVAGQGMKPFQPAAWDGDRIIDPSDGDIQRITQIGSGVLMFQMQHIRKLKQPWFFERVELRTYQREGSMDSTFVDRLQKEGEAEVWVDTTIDVKHIHPFKMDRSFQNRFDDWMQGGGDPELCAYEGKT